MRRWRLGAALIAPNLIWNLSNSFATFAHTADNAKWGGALFEHRQGLRVPRCAVRRVRPDAVCGARGRRDVARVAASGLPEPDRLLLAFTLPVLLVVTAQAFVSRAHANWAATAYVAGTVLVTAALLREARRGWLTGSLAHACGAGGV